MSSGRYISIKLDPYYQQFLRTHFNQTEQVFSFPKAHGLLIRLEYYLSKQPADYIPQPSDNTETFIIAIPYMEHKNPDTYNYLSKKAQRMYVTKILDYYKMIVREEISSRRRKGFQKDEIILTIMEDLGLSMFNDDRIKRDYSRYLNAERFRKHKNKSKSSKKLAS